MTDLTNYLMPPQEPNMLAYDDTQGMTRQRPADPLRWLADYVGQNKDLPAPQFFMDPRALSLRNMLHSALNTSANWLDGTRDPSLIGPQEMVSPLGLAPMAGVATRGASAPARAAVMADNSRSSAPGVVVNSLAEARTGTSPAAGHPSGYAAPNQPPSPIQPGQQGHMPVSSSGPQGPGGHSLMPSDPSSVPFDASAIRRAYETRSDLPEGWYVHGRNGQESLRDDAVIQATRSYDTMEQYAGKNGSGWAIRPKDGAKVLDLTADSPQIRKIAQQMMADYRSGRLPHDMEQMLPPNPAVADFHKAALEFSPNRIVESAQAFDSVPMVNWLYERRSPDFVRTPDGAVAMHADALDKVRLFADNSRSSAPGTVVNSLDMSEAARMQRAKEMGFDTEQVAYRGLTRPYDQDKAGYYQMFTSSPHEAGEYAMKNPFGSPSVVPAYLRRGRTLDVDAQEANFRNVFTGKLPDDVRAKVGESATIDEISHAARGAGYDSVRVRNVYDNVTDEKPAPSSSGSRPSMSDDDLLAALGVDVKPSPKGTPRLDVHEEFRRAPVDIDVVFDPSRIRSPFAAFDPAKRDSALLLAADNSRSSAPGTVVNSIAEPQTIRAYHGSPHDFDKFSMDKIGTGEGSQAFGRGLYFAENPQTAAAYRPQGGRSYEVGIRGKPDEFLDLDAPMSAQPQQVRDTMLRVAQEEMTRKGWPESYQRQMLDDIVGEARTQDAFSRFTGLFHRADQPDAGDTLAAQALAGAGIKGTRFLDAGSREAGQGTRNYVVFDDGLVDINRKYSRAGDASAPGLAANSTQQEDQGVMSILRRYGLAD